MAVNKYFQSGITSTSAGAQSLYSRMIKDSMKINGFDVYYLPRTSVNISEVFGEDPLSKFDHAIKIEMHMDNVKGFDGDGSFLSRFGVEINDTCNFQVHKERWMEEISARGISALPNRPTEGDMLFFPLSSTLFEIKKVVSTNPFYQLGKLYVWNLECETVQYSSERINTGVPEIDSNPYLFNLAAEEYGLDSTDGLDLLSEDGTALISDAYDLAILDKGSQNGMFQTKATPVLDWNETNPFGEPPSL